MPEGAGGTEPRTWDVRGSKNYAGALFIVDGPELEPDEVVRVVEQQPPTEGGDLYRCGCTVRPTEGRALTDEDVERGARASARTAAGIIELLPPGPPADYPERLDKALRAGDIHEVRRLRARRNLANEGANPSERPETWDPATVDAVVRELESEDDVTVNVKLTSGPKFRAGWDAAVAHIRERFKGAARDTGGRT